MKIRYGVKVQRILISIGIMHNSNSSQEEFREMSQLSVLWQESSLRFCNAGAITLAHVSFLWTFCPKALHRCRKSVGSISAGGRIVYSLYCLQLEFELFTIPLEIKKLWRWKIVISERIHGQKLFATFSRNTVERYS